MRIVCISDTHTFESEIRVPEGDVLIHAGDATIEGSVDEVRLFGQWFNFLSHKHKVFVAGNHDWLFERKPELARQMLRFDGVHYLQDSSAEIEGLRFYGSPWQPRFNDWAFNLDRGAAIKEKWDRIPACDVLITHGPVWGILDTVAPNSLHIGCEDLAAAVRRVKPRVHVCGHIHGGYGEYVAVGTHYINASICDEAYRPINAPIVIDL